MATTPPYGGQWKDPKTGQFNQAGYDAYIKDINQKYIDRLRTTPNAEGKYRTTEGYTVGGVDYGYGAGAPAAPLAAADAGKDLKAKTPVQNVSGGRGTNTGMYGTVLPAAPVPRANTVRGINQANLPQAAPSGSPLPSQTPRVVFRPNLRAGSPISNPLANAKGTARTEGDERARRRRDLEQFFRSLGIVGGGLSNMPLVGPVPAMTGIAGAGALNGLPIPGVSGVPSTSGVPEEARGGGYGGGGGGGGGGLPNVQGLPYGYPTSGGAASPSVRDGIIRGTAPGGAQLPPFYPTNVTGGGANMQAPSYDWMETNPPNQYLFGYGSQPPPVGGWEPVTPGSEFSGDPGVAGWHIAPDETQAPTLGGGPYVPPVPRRGGGGGGGGEGGGYGGWGEYDLESHPEWWKGLSAGNSEDQQFASILNAMIPSMSPEDQRTAASTLARMFPEFESYNSLTNQGMTPPVPSEVTDATTQQYETTQRAQSILEAITRMGAAGGIKTGTSSEVSPAVAWLQQIADLGKDFGISGATEMMTPAQLQALMAALDPLLAEAKGTGSKVAPYAEIARMLTEPFYSAGKVFPRSTGANGQMAFGQPNRTIF